MALAVTLSIVLGLCRHLVYCYFLQKVQPNDFVVAKALRQKQNISTAVCTYTHGVCGVVFECLSIR